MLRIQSNTLNALRRCRLFQTTTCNSSNQYAVLSQGMTDEVDGGQELLLVQESALVSS
jgi:hypothetical protein